MIWDPRDSIYVSEKCISKPHQSAILRSRKGALHGMEWVDGIHPLQTGERKLRVMELQCLQEIYSMEGNLELHKSLASMIITARGYYAREHQWKYLELANLQKHFRRICEKPRKPSETLNSCGSGYMYVLTPQIIRTAVLTASHQFLTPCSRELIAHISV